MPTPAAHNEPTAIQDTNIWDFSDLRFDNTAETVQPQQGRRLGHADRTYSPKPPVSPAPPRHSPRSILTTAGDPAINAGVTTGIRLPALTRTFPTSEAGGAASPQSPLSAPIRGLCSPRQPPRPSVQFRNLLGQSKRRPEGEPSATPCPPYPIPPSGAALPHGLLTSLVCPLDSRRSNSMPPSSRPGHAAPTVPGLQETVLEGHLRPDDPIPTKDSNPGSTPDEPMRRKASSVLVSGGRRRLPVLKHGGGRQLLGKIVAPSFNS